MSRKQDKNLMQKRAHKKAVEDKKNRDPAAKRQRQKFTATGLKAIDEKKEPTYSEKLRAVLNGEKPLKADEVYRADTSRGRRSIARAEKKVAQAIAEADKNDAALMAALEQ